MLKARLKIRSPKNNRRARLSFQRILKRSFILTQACPDSSLKRKAAAQRSARNKTNDANRKRAELRAGYNALLPQDYRKVPLNIPPLPSQRKWTSHRRLEVVMMCGLRQSCYSSHHTNCLPLDLVAQKHRSSAKLPTSGNIYFNATLLRLI